MNGTHVRTHKVGALFTLNSQWKVKMVFGAASPLVEGLGFEAFCPSENSSTAAVVFMLRAPGM